MGNKKVSVRIVHGFLDLPKENKQKEVKMLDVSRGLCEAWSVMESERQLTD